MRRTFALLLLTAVTVPAGAAAQQTCPSRKDSTASMGGMGDMGMMMDHAMMARMDSLDARMDSLNRVVQRATGTRKLNAMSALLSMLTAHHLDMRRMMHEHMMGQVDMPGMSGSPGAMMRMDGSGCTPAAPRDSTTSRDPMHQH